MTPYLHNIFLIILWYDNTLVLTHSSQIQSTLLIANEMVCHNFAENNKAIFQTSSTFEGYPSIVDQDVYTSILVFEVCCCCGDAAGVIDVQLVEHGFESLWHQGLHSLLSTSTRTTETYLKLTLTHFRFVEIHLYSV